MHIPIKLQAIKHRLFILMDFSSIHHFWLHNSIMGTRLSFLLIFISILNLLSMLLFFFLVGCKTWVCCSTFSFLPRWADVEQIQKVVILSIVFHQFNGQLKLTKQQRIPFDHTPKKHPLWSYGNFCCPIEIQNSKFWCCPEL